MSTMFKKILSVIAACVIAASLVACGGGSSTTNPNTDSSGSSSSSSSSSSSNFSIADTSAPSVLTFSVQNGPAIPAGNDGSYAVSSNVGSTQAYTLTFSEQLGAASYTVQMLDSNNATVAWPTGMTATLVTNDATQLSYTLTITTTTSSLAFAPEETNKIIQLQATVADVSQNETKIPINATLMPAPWGPADAPILIVLGQSNSYGHNAALPASQQVTTPYTNVLTLDRTLNNNALYSANMTSAAISWVGMTTLGKHNIGTDNTGLGAQDHTCNAANQFAKLWQDHITAGNALGLPNLYVILMGKGSQGIDNSIGWDSQWYPDRAATDVLSLYPRAVKTLELAIANIRAQGKNPRIIAIHWNQWESDATTDTAANNSLRNFQRIVNGVSGAFGAHVRVPWRFFWPLTTVYDTTPSRRPKVQNALTTLVAGDPAYRSFLDVRTASHYNSSSSPWFGVFNSDRVHYNVTTQTWFAQQEWARVQSGWRGVVLPGIN